MRSGAPLSASSRFVVGRRDAFSMNNFETSVLNGPKPHEIAAAWLSGKQCGRRGGSTIQYRCQNEEEQQRYNTCNRNDTT